MSLEAITRIRSVEEGMDQAKADARAQAQKLAAEAEREGRALLQQGREQAAKAAAAEMEKRRPPPPNAGRKSWRRRIGTAKR